MQSRNPRQIAAFIMVDVSPRWITGCTIVEPRQNLDEESYDMARVAERIGCLARHVEGLDVPIIVVESGTLDRLDVSACTESGLRWVDCMAGIVCASLSAGSAQGGYESFRCAMPSFGRLVKSHLALWQPFYSPAWTFHPGSMPASEPDCAVESPFNGDAAVERAVYFGRDS